MVSELVVFDIVGERALDDGLWHHVVAVFDPARQVAELYVDGVIDVSASAESTPSDDAGFSIGSFTWTLDEVAVYRSALTAAQVSAHYDARMESAGGPGIVTYAVEPNPDIVSREGAIAVGGLVVPVLQDARPCLIVAADSILLGAAGGSGSMAVSAVDEGCARGR
jgi:hypothetical protein